MPIPFLANNKYELIPKSWVKNILDIFKYFLLPTVIFILLLNITLFFGQTIGLGLSFIFLLVFLNIIIILLDPLPGMFITIIGAIYIFISNIFHQYFYFTYPIYIIPIFLIFGLSTSFLLEFAYRRDKSIAKSERHFRSLSNQSIYPIILKNNKGQVLYTSSSIKRYLGFNEKELKKIGMENLIHPDDIIKHRKAFTKVLKKYGSHRGVEIRIKHKNGSWIWMKNDFINLQNDADIGAIVTSIQNISSRKQIDAQRLEIIKSEKIARLKSRTGNKRARRVFIHSFS